MRQLPLLLGHTSLKIAGLIAGGALIAAFAACAEAPVDDDPGGVRSESNKAEPEQESQKLPPSNPPAQQQQSDAGTKDSGTPKSDSGTSSSSGGSSSGGSSSGGSSSGGSSSGGTGGSCDPNDFTMLIKAVDELNKTSPRTCGSMGGSCAATECCFDIYGVCVDL